MVLIPAHNEAVNIGPVLRELKQMRISENVMVVDSGCVDSTAEIARSYGAQVIEQGGVGYAGAIRVGHQLALQRGAEKLVQLDADGQHPPSAIFTLLHALQDYDWVIGSRHRTGSLGTPVRRIGSALIGGIARKMGPENLHDFSSGYWAMNQEALAVLSQLIPGETVDANLRVRAHRHGLKIGEVPVVMDVRKNGLSMHHGLKGVSNGLGSIRNLLQIR